MPVKKPKSPAERKKAVEKLEEMNPEGDPAALDPNAPFLEPEETEENPEVEENTEEEEENPEENPEEEEEEENPEEKPEVDWKKRHDDSAREAQVLIARQKKEREIREKAKTLPEPTEADLRAEFPEWDDLTPFEQRMARQSVHQNNKLKLIESIDEEVKNDENFIIGVNGFSADPKTLEKFPKLEGREAEFLQFAQKPSRRGLDLEDVATIFSANIPDKKKVVNKGSLMERGTSSSNKNMGQPQQLSPEQMDKLRKTNFRLWTKLTLKNRKAQVHSRAIK